MDVYEPPRFMTIRQCIDQLLEIEQKEKEGIFTPETKCVGLARVGQPDQVVRWGTVAQLKEFDFGGPLHSFVISGKTHILEDEVGDLYKIRVSEAKGCSEA